MDSLKKQVNDSLGSVSVFRNVHEDDRDYIHAYCLAIAFYLDHYRKTYDHKLMSSEVFAKIEQTHEFSKGPAANDVKSSEVK